MFKKALAIFALVLLPSLLPAQDKKIKTPASNPNKWDKPYDFNYYDMMLGYASAPGPVYDINAMCFWGRARTSFVNFIINRQPKHKFQVRDIVDAQIGVGYGSRFYANAMFAGGLKFKYDISAKVDFGCNMTYRVSMDMISYITGMIHGFARFDKFFVEVGTGGNGDISPTDKQRKVTNINVKYFFNPNARGLKWSLNATYWKIQGRNNQVNNDWETMGQYMIGIGFQ